MVLGESDGGLLGREEEFQVSIKEVAVHTVVAADVDAGRSPLLQQEGKEEEIVLEDICATVKHV